jgi:transposase
VDFQVSYTLLAMLFGNPLKFFVTAGQRSDYVKALDLLEGRKMEVLIADKEYDANHMIEAAESLNAHPVRSNRKTPREYDKALYKERNLIERMFIKLNTFVALLRVMIN